MVEIQEFKSVEWINSANQTELSSEIEWCKAYMIDRISDPEFDILDDHDFKEVIFYWGLVVKQLKALG